MGANALASAGRLAGIGVSDILKIMGDAQERRAAGEDIIALAAGEPDFDTPDHIKCAAQEAIAQGETHYTPLTGTAELKKAVAEKFARENGLEFAPSQIIVSSGAKQVIFNAMMATLNPGDEVILPAPYWTSYLDIVRICGGTPVPVPCSPENGLRLTAESLGEAITPRTRWLFFNSPSNPSGAAYDADAYAPLLDVVRSHPGLAVLADDIYEHLVYDDFRFATPAALAPELKDRILTINGVSKSFAMTGWRIGFAAGPQRLIDAMAVVQSQSTSCASSISQAAAVAALSCGMEFLADRLDSFRVRRDHVVSAVNAIGGLSCRSPKGAFYAYVNCEALIKRRTADDLELKSDADVARYLLARAGAAVVPGSAFGLSPYFRISYATALPQLERACRRIAEAVGELR